MIATDQFVYIHLERTAGNFFANFIKKFFPSAKSIGYHYPRPLLPDAYKSLPVIGFVRNPFDWYVSFYFHKARMNVPGVKTLGFEQLTRGLLYLNSADPYYVKFKEGFKELCPASIVGNVSMGVTKQELTDFKQADVGFYTWLFRRMFADLSGSFDNAHIGLYENLVDETRRLLDLSGVNVTDEMSQYLKDMTKVNQTEHSNYREYFDHELRSDLEKQEMFLLEKYQYKF